MDFSVIKNNLESFGYTVKIFENISEANNYLNLELDNKSIGIGGTLTVEQMGIYDLLKTHNKILWHWKPVDGLSPVEMRRIYFYSVNAISKTG